MLIKLTYTSLYKISASTTEKHASALYQLVIDVQEVVIYFKIEHAYRVDDGQNSWKKKNVDGFKSLTTQVEPYYRRTGHPLS